MLLSTKHTLTKLSVGCSLAVAVLITGCNETVTTDEAANATDNSTVAVSNDTTADDVNQVAVTQDELVMTTITLDTVDQMLFAPLLTNGELTQEQVTCLEARDSNLGKAEVDAFYKSKFTDAELEALNEFYASAVGQKLLDFGKQQLLVMNGQEIASPMAEPTPQEMAEIQTFMQSPLGAKYAEVNNAEGAGSAMEVINVPLNAEFKRCNIDIEL